MLITFDVKFETREPAQQCIFQRTVVDQRDLPRENRVGSKIPESMTFVGDLDVAAEILRAQVARTKPQPLTQALS